MSPKDDIKAAAYKIFGPEPAVPHPDGLTGVPRGVQEIMDDTAKSIGAKIWRGIVKASTSGFGKGVILTALAATAFLALSSGFGLLAGGATFGEGLMTGLGTAFSQAGLLSGSGLFALAIGGTLGAFMDVRKEQGKISAEVAQAQANTYALIRNERQQQREQELNKNEPDISYVARELQRRSNQPTPQQGKY